MATEQTVRRDWPAIRTRFAAGDLSTRAFAVAEGVPYGTLARRAQLDGWEAARVAFRATVATGSAAKIARQRIASEAAIDGSAHRAALAISRIARRVLRNALTAATLDDAPRLRALVDAVTAAHRLARVTAHLPAEPVPSVGEAGDGMTIILRRRNPAGETYETTFPAAG